MDNKPEDELSAFRQQWKKELESQSSSHKEPVPKEEEPPPVELTDEDRAKQLFLHAAELERSGKLYEAIHYYKRAMQILPDVETRLYYESTELRADTPEVEVESPRQACVDAEADSDDEGAVAGEDLTARLRRILARKGWLCEPEIPVTSGHISWLPYEVVQLILRWTVGSELDAVSLERAAAACRALYLAAREPELWRALCVRTWGRDCGAPRQSGHASWRDMFVRRPRALTHGCYVSKTTYLRRGEPAFQDHTYQPCFLIEYYRYLRFFPDGVVLMWTTPDEPGACVSALRTRALKPGLGVVAGHYRLAGDELVIVIKKPSTESGTRVRSRRRDAQTDANDATFHLELQLQHSRTRRNCTLAWRRYSLLRRGQCSQFQLTPGRFPPFHFSRVRSYHAESIAPLSDVSTYV